MKNRILLLIASIGMMLASCGERVEPNYYGVLMTNYGKNGKSDYKQQKGRVWVSVGEELYQVPSYEQRGGFGTRVLHLKAEDNTQFTARPEYSYKVIEGREVDLVFKNARLAKQDTFMLALEDNVLEPRIYDLIKEESRKYLTDTLMANGGSIKFENVIQEKIKKAFEENGLELITFSTNLDFSDKVKDKIDKRNEVNTNVSVIDQQIIEQRKRNELSELEAQERIIISKGLTPQYINYLFIQRWDGKTPLYGNIPLTLTKPTK